MKWRDRRQSSNVEDRRSLGTGQAAGIGGVGLLIVLALSLLFKVDPREILGDQALNGGGGQAAEPAPLSAEDQELGQFVSVVLADTEDVWNGKFQAMDKQYVEPKLVLFSGQVQSACGTATAAVGPFYCPGDQQVYIDLDFYKVLRQRLGAPGDFAQAYVIAHEVGHHVQNLLGISDQVERGRGGASEAEANALSVRLELQADCFAGIWARGAEEMKDVLEAGDLDEAINAAQAIGDDRLQKQSQGYVVPDSFTHGTSEERSKWLARGVNEGTIEACDTFSGSIDIEK
ncbi:MAG: neutral zinc metallopeptidase [Ardenticatenales bacterium]